MCLLCNLYMCVFWYIYIGVFVFFVYISVMMCTYCPVERVACAHPFSFSFYCVGKAPLIF